MKWVEALKAYAAKKGKYVVPKKGTPEYEEGRAMMGGAAAPKAAAAAPAVEEAHAAAKKGKKRVEVLERMEKVKAARKEKAADSLKPRPAARKMKVLDSNAAEAKPEPKVARRKAGSVPAGMIPEGATKKAVMAAKNPEAVLESATNAHLPIVAAEDMVGLRLPKPRKLKMADLPALVDKDKPVDGVPFSFQKFRNELGC
jgi:hypothetical protein